MTESAMGQESVVHYGLCGYTPNEKFTKILFLNVEVSQGWGVTVLM